jgi:RNA polymerase sigma-70 factor (ECF subfamily)
VRFECLNRLKRMKLQERMRRALPFDVPADEDAHDDEEMQYLEYQQFIKTGLTEQTRRVFQLHYGSQRLKYREIAEQLGISEAAVYKHLSQAIVKLKNRFSK